MNADVRILKLARRYIWWKMPQESMEFPQQVYASVMNLGTYEDVQELVALVGESTLRETLAAAEAGQFRPQSWSYWQVCLNGLTDAQIPPGSQRYTMTAAYLLSSLVQ